MRGQRSVRPVDRVEQEIAILVANEERVRLAMQAGRIYFWDWDVAEDYIVWFGGLEQELLIDFAPSNADAFKALVHPDDLALVSKKLEAALRGPGDYEAEFRMVRKDGSIRWTSTRAIVIRDCLGFGVRLVGCDQDITAQRESLDRALQSEASLRVALENIAAAEGVSRTGTWDCNLRTRETHVSQSYRALFGFDDGVLITDEVWIARVHPEDRSIVKSYLADFYKNGSRFDLKFRIVHPTRGVRRLAGIGMLTRGNDGSPLRFTGINVDISDRNGTAEFSEGPL